MSLAVLVNDHYIPPTLKQSVSLAVLVNDHDIPPTLKQSVSLAVLVNDHDIHPTLKQSVSLAVRAALSRDLLLSLVPEYRILIKQVFLLMWLREVWFNVVQHCEFS